MIGVAGHGADIVEGAVAGGIPREKTRFFADSEEAAKFFDAFLENGDVVLVKGSRGVKMERIVEALLARHLTSEDPTSGRPAAGVRH